MNVTPPNAGGNRTNGNRPQGRTSATVNPPNAGGNRANGANGKGRSASPVTEPAMISPGTGGGASGRGNNHDIARPAQGTQAIDGAGMIPGSMRRAK